MREGGERRIFVPSAFGYGRTGDRGLNVPPDTTLVIGWFRYDPCYNLHGFNFYPPCSDCKLVEIV
jgi:hypothetical protein